MGSSTALATEGDVGESPTGGTKMVYKGNTMKYIALGAVAVAVMLAGCEQPRPQTVVYTAPAPRPVGLGPPYPYSPYGYGSPNYVQPQVQPTTVIHKRTVIVQAAPKPAPRQTSSFNLSKPSTSSYKPSTYKPSSSSSFRSSSSYRSSSSSRR